MNFIKATKINSINFEMKTKMEKLRVEYQERIKQIDENQIKLEEDYDINLYEGFKCQVNGIIDQRIQSLAITLDKIKHVLSLISSSNNNIEPPLRFLTEKEKYEYHWKPIKEYLRENFNKLKEKLIKEDNKDNNYLIEKYQKIILSLAPPIFVAGELNYNNLNIESKDTLIKISKILYEISKKQINKRERQK